LYTTGDILDKKNNTRKCSFVSASSFCTLDYWNIILLFCMYNN